MKILVVDDNLDKIKHILSVINDISGYKIDRTDYALESIDAKRKLEEIYYDIVILDIMLPERINGKVVEDGGVKLLEEIKRKPKYNYPGNVIGITSSESVIEKYKNSFFSCIKYEADTWNWKEELDSYIKLALDTTLSKQRNSIVDYNYDVAIVCALRHTELEAIKKVFGLEKLVEHKNDCESYFEGSIGKGKNIKKIVATSCVQMGLTSAAVSTMKIIERYRPRYVFMTGIAAGIKGKVNFGDILIADPIWNYSNGKYITRDNDVFFCADPIQLRMDVELSRLIVELSYNKEILKQIKKEYDGEAPRNNLDCKIGSFASGEAVLANSKKIESVKDQSRNLIGIDMEAYSVYFAGQYCTKPKPKVASIKSVCDFGDETKGDNYHDYAAYTSAKFLYILINQYL
ncbi:response regulator receiver protein [Clostridium pasteurianum DSM 525 = ATCC 6013]|uniref:Stage 0 sporulation protein A homolog n=1 Tax=Clostridium pasteurianum DSM 525 = ATCC 6013 TaxID=1262449 RepID=A0A0H3J4Q3_CLOPA|nr:response regulator [Clostridium pasteurianum]AJA48474.1 response regulator receiver protein [Clostridium pasteurianum DSM 525 = ATCC 6013]AJA52462.1 response regulator receiver protein [Clostridium pasteurianum DSM 525 = ATCC 6013]AOZ75716.1 hypothetical protein AQ983_11690 [Clostridium pasteurianum DSM 525 = ATCC 6013]AOZ79512.1 hypothetical protein AQ984_11685 [Clostridium pasteurianum]ELP60378.1 response regulator receiver protein [Clostridium pasteurianum DSM 525 = ATCC 6013]